MSENGSRSLSIARELITWGDALSSILAKIDELLESPKITSAQATNVQTIADSVGAVMRGIWEAVRTNDYDRLVSSVERLREEIVAAGATLEHLLNRQSSG